MFWVKIIWGVSVWVVSSLVFSTATSMSWAGDDWGCIWTIAVDVLRWVVILSQALSSCVYTRLPLSFLLPLLPLMSLVPSMITTISCCFSVSSCSPLSSRSCSLSVVYTPLITAQSLSSGSKCGLMYFLLGSAISIFFVLFCFGLGRFSWLMDGFGSCLFMCSLSRWSFICSVSSRSVWRSFAISLVSSSLSLSSCIVFWSCSFCSWSFWMFFFSVSFFGLLHFLAFLLLNVFRFYQLVDFFCSFSVSDGVPSVSVVCFSRFSIFVCRSVIRSCCAMILASWLSIWDCLSLFSFSAICSFYCFFCCFQFSFELLGLVCLCLLLDRRRLLFSVWFGAFRVWCLASPFVDVSVI